MSPAVPAPAPAPAPSHETKTSSALTAQQQSDLLAAQNVYRTALGEPPLAWSDTLAAGAQEWAVHLATEAHALVHSGVPGTGENLALYSGGRASLSQLVQLWGAEKPAFVNAKFPDISRTGNWMSTAHYSQIVWRNTTSVGCGLASGGGKDYLVCRYTPAGNVAGERPY
ncbi:MAG TPA: CAP domain-containing protein [Rhizomicrobium sp.]